MSWWALWRAEVSEKIGIQIVEAEYLYSYSYLGHFFKPNNIRICWIFSSQIIYVFIFGWFSLTSRFVHVFGPYLYLALIKNYAGLIGGNIRGISPCDAPQHCHYAATPVDLWMEYLVLCTWVTLCGPTILCTRACTNSQCGSQHERLIT